MTNQDGGDDDRHDPADPVDTVAAVTAERCVDVPTQDDASDAAQDGQPDGDVVLVARRDQLAKAAR